LGIGRSHASRPRLVESEKEFSSGIVDRQTGFGQVTVRAHNQATTVAWQPSGRAAFG
jgi:hypothetical protein